MIEGPSIQRGRAAEGIMREAAVMVVGTTKKLVLGEVGAEAEVGAEVGACKLLVHALIVLQVQAEMGTRRGHLYLAI